MRKVFLHTDFKGIKSPVVWFGNIISTIFCVGVLLLVYMFFVKIDIAEITNIFELFKKLWWVVLLGYIFKFLIAYYGQHKRGLYSYWLGAYPELVLYLLTFVVILLTGNYGA